MENLVEVMASDIAPRSHPAPVAGQELRLALAMRGGVSLAVWIGGAVSEIERLRRAGLSDRRQLQPGSEDGPRTVYGNLLKLAGYCGVTVDVLAGASAGGLNGAVYAAAQCHGFDVAELRDVWLTLGDIETSSRGTTSGRRAADHATHKRSTREDALRPPSLLDGDAYFYETMRAKLEELIVRPPDATGAVEQIDLVLSATLYRPQDLGVQVNRLTSVQDSGSEALFRFRRGPAGDDLACGERGRPVDAGRAATLARRLAMAARASSSFPVAFEPARIRLTGDEEPTFDGIFIPPGWPTPDEMKKGFDVMDGGVLDNIPITAAIRAIVDAPADGPTDRWLLYLHPSPTPEPDPETGSSGAVAARLGTPRAAVTTAKFLAARLGQESALADMRELQAVNDTVRRRQQATEATFSGFLGDDALSRLEAAWTAARAELDDIWARLEMKSIVTALNHPATGGAIAARTSDRADGATVPWPKWSDQDQLDLPGQLYSVLLAERDRPWRTPVWLAEVVRVLICWASDVGRRTTADDGRGGEAAGRLKLAAYHLRAAVTALDRAQKRHWVGASWERDASSSLTEWVAATHAAAPRHPADDPEMAAAVATALENIPAAPADGDAGGTGLDGEVTDLLWEAAVELAGHLAALAPEGDVSRPVAWVAAVLERVPTARLADGLRYAISLSATIALLGPAPEREIRFGILSGEARSALDDRFVALKADRRDDKDKKKRFPDTAWLRPSDKLCGDDLGNFAAFLSARWRLNDWMWGRLDAAATLVDNLLDPQRLERMGTCRPQEFLRTARLAVVGDPTEGRYFADQWAKSEPQLLAAVEAGNWEAITDLLRPLVVERIQVTILGEELPVLASLEEATKDTDPDGPPPEDWQPEKNESGAPKVLAPEEVMERVGTHRVGRETMADLNDHRRVRVLLRAALVGFGTLRPAGGGLAAETGRWALSLVKPLVLIAAFVATSVRRGLFVGAVALAPMQATYWRADAGLNWPPDRWFAVLLVGAVAAGTAWFLVPQKPKDNATPAAGRKPARRAGFALAALVLAAAAGLSILWRTGGHFAVSTFAATGIAFVTAQRWRRRRHEADRWERRMNRLTIALAAAGIYAGSQLDLADEQWVGSWHTDFAVPFLLLCAGALVVSVTGTFWMTTPYRFLVAVLVVGAYAGTAVPFWDEGWPEWAATGSRLAAAVTVAILVWVALADLWTRNCFLPREDGTRAEPWPRWLIGPLAAAAGTATFFATVYARPGWSHRVWVALAVPVTAYALTMLATYAEVLTPRPIRDQRKTASMGMRTGGTAVASPEQPRPPEPGMVPAGAGTT